MYVDNEIKLDFQDVLIRPKRSVLESRSQVDLIRTFTTKNGAVFSGVPVIASNMVTGTFPMLESLAKNKMFTAIAKHHNNEWKEKVSNLKDSCDILNYGFYTIGMNLDELNDLIVFADTLGEKSKNLKICIDIANGYVQRFASFVSKVRSAFPCNVLFVGNVVTPEMVQELVIAGADFIKIGIGPGKGCTTRLKTGVGFPQISASVECWEPHTLIKCRGGIKKISEILEGYDEVLTHSGKYKRVLNVIENQENRSLLSINKNLSTKNHKYYVVHKKWKNIITEENMTQYAQWIEAKDITTEYLLIKRDGAG